MRIGRSKLAGLLVASAALMMLTLPGTIVLAHDGGQGHDASAEGHHDAGGGGGGGVEAAGGGHGAVEAAAGGGSHVETTSPDAGKNGDTMGDLKSNMHTGAKGRGAGGDDKTELAAKSSVSASRSAEVARPAEVSVVTHRAPEVTVVTTAVAPAHAVVVESARETARPGGAAAGAAAVTTPEAAAAVTAPSGAVLGAEQTARAPSIGAPQVLGAQQTRPRTLPFTGLSAAWAMLMTGGRWVGVLFSALGLLLLARGLKRS